MYVAKYNKILKGKELHLNLSFLIAQTRLLLIAIPGKKSLAFSSCTEKDSRLKQMDAHAETEIYLWKDIQKETFFLGKKKIISLLGSTLLCNRMIELVSPTLPPIVYVKYNKNICQEVGRECNI